MLASGHPLPLLRWPIPLDPWLEMPSAAGGEPAIHYDWAPKTVKRKRGAVQRPHRDTSSAGILDVFLALADEPHHPIDALRFVERFGPLYLDEDGLVVADFSSRVVHSPESVARIRHYAIAARAIRELGLHLAAHNRIPPPPSTVSLVGGVLDEYIAIVSSKAHAPFYKAEPWVQKAFVTGPQGVERYSVLVQTDSGAARLQAIRTLRNALNWWLGVRRVGPWFIWPSSGALGSVTHIKKREMRQSGDRVRQVGQFRPVASLDFQGRAARGPGLGLYGSAWGAIGLRLAEELAGMREQNAVFCDIGQHFFYPKRNPPVGRLACCSAKRCRAERNRSYQETFRRRQRSQVRSSLSSPE